MSCHELAELLIDFVAGELPTPQRERVETHLNACPPCVTYLETYRLTIQLTRKLPCVPLPPQLVVKLRQVLEEFRSETSGGRGAPGGPCPGPS
jgi:anti-sigma factor RsiW